MADYQMVQNDTLVRLVTSQKQKKTLIDTYSLTLSAMGQTLGWGRLLHIYHSRSQVPSFEFKKRAILAVLTVALPISVILSCLVSPQATSKP